MLAVRPHVTPAESALSKLHQTLGLLGWALLMFTAAALAALKNKVPSPTTRARGTQLKR